MGCTGKFVHWLLGTTRVAKELRLFSPAGSGKSLSFFATSMGTHMPFQNSLLSLNPAEAITLV